MKYTAGDVLWVELPPDRRKKYKERRPAIALKDEENRMIPVILLTIRITDSSRYNIPLSGNGMKGTSIDGRIFSIRSSRVIRKLRKADNEQLNELLKRIYTL